MSTDTDPTPTEPAVEPSSETDAQADEPSRPSESVALDAPDIKSARTILGEFWAWRKWRKKRRKYADKGYIKWKLIGSTEPAPKFIKPELNGGGIAEYEHQGETYLFPKRAALPDPRTGMLTFYHREGDAKPINPQSGQLASIDPADLKEYLTKRPTASPPSWLDSFDLDGQTLLYLMIGLVLAVGIAQQFL